MKDTCVIMPVYNEESVIADTIEKLSLKFNCIICVNDGSTDKSREIIEETDAILVNHSVQLGQGAAIQTGLDFAVNKKFLNYFVTFDADGQHNPSDAVKMVRYIKKNPVDIVVGSRFLSQNSSVPISKKILLKIAVLYSNTTKNIQLTDTHNGLRAFNRHVAETVDLELNGMGHASEFIQKISDNNYRYAELPVTINYTSYSRRKGQPVINSLNILFELIESKFSKHG